jgi:hypothetical protein
MSQYNDCKIGKAQVKSGITVVECERQAMLLLRQPLDTETALGKILQEPLSGARATALANQVVDLGSNRRRNDQRPGFCFEEPADNGMARIAGITQSNQGRRVDDEGQLPNPRKSSSSGMSATEVPSPSQAPLSAKARSAVSCDSYAASAARMISAWLRPSRRARRCKRSRSASSKYRLVFFILVG